MRKIIKGSRKAAAALAVFALMALAPTFASAQAENWQVYFDEPASPIMEDIVSFNNGLMILITVITLFVLALLAWVIIRYRAKVHPVPSKTTHNTVVEVLWTVLPVLILVGIAIPSFSLLFAQYDPGRVLEDYDPEEALYVKVTGQTWNWNYAYPDSPEIRPFISAPISDIEATRADGTPRFAGEPRLLETDYPLVVPVNTVVHLHVTSNPSGVLHAFALPAMGVKLDAVPGRITESWFLAEREGTFYGQCSELCGQYHYAMPIELRVVSEEQFAEWLAVAGADGVAAAKVLLDEWEAEREAEQVAALESE